MTQDRDELRRLHFINALFAHVTGQDLYLAHQIKSAIAFNLAELEAQAAAGPLPEAGYSAAFNAAAARLLDRLFLHLPRHGFFHWDASRTLHSGTPLFARAEVMSGLKHLAPVPRSDPPHHEPAPGRAAAGPAGDGPPPPGIRRPPRLPARPDGGPLALGGRPDPLVLVTGPGPE